VHRNEEEEEARRNIFKLKMVDFREDYSSLKEAGQNIIEFGKHQGRTYSDVAATEPDYCEWAMRQRDPTLALEHFVDYLLSC
jgi:hypothetical protein